MADDTREARKGRAPPDTLERYWPELRGRVQERWSRLTDDWLGEVEGRQARLAEKLRDAYGISEAEANRQVEEFVETHWGALSAGNLTPASTSTSDSAGALRGGNTGGTLGNTSSAARGATPAGAKNPEQDRRH